MDAEEHLLVLKAPAGFQGTQARDLRCWTCPSDPYTKASSIYRDMEGVDLQRSHWETHLPEVEGPQKAEHCPFMPN
jgi:hypothetical protein